MVRLRHDSAGRDRERVVVLAPAHRRRAEPGAEIDALNGGNREEEIGERRLDRFEERLADAGRNARHDRLDDAADAVAVLSSHLDFRDHAVRRVEVGTPDSVAFDVGLNLLRSDRSSGDPTNLGRMRVEPNTYRCQHLSGDRPRDDHGSRHPAGELAASPEIALRSILHRGGEISVPGTRDPRHVGIGFRLHVLVADEGDNRLARRQPVRDAFREFHAIRLLALAGDEALSRSAAIELRLDEGLVDSCPGAQSLDRAAHERTVARPEDRCPVSRAEDVHPTTA